jgi:hypothetical protein
MEAVVNAGHRGKTEGPSRNRPGEGTTVCINACDLEPLHVTDRKDRTMNAIDLTSCRENEAPTCRGEEPGAAKATTAYGVPPAGRSRQVYLEGYGQEAEVDELIAPLIMELWRCGIRISHSAQKAAHGFVFLQFPTVLDATEFLKTVAPEYDPEDHSLYERVLGHYADCKKWVIKSRLVDYHRIEILNEDGTIDVSHRAKPCLGFTVSVWFPPSDLPAVMARLDAHGKAGQYRLPPLSKAL